MTTPLGWGRDPFGTSPYGSAVQGTGIGLVSAVAISTHEVQVTLSGAAVHVNPDIAGDALNTLTWQIQRLDTQEFLHIILSTVVEPNIYILTTVEAFGPYSVLHALSTNTLLDLNGVVIHPPRVVQFAGLIAATEASPLASVAQRSAATSDIANPQQPNGTDLIGGTLLVSSSGDYEEESGEDLVRKLILRRLISSPGDFFHLPDYGIGLRLKEPTPAGDVVKLKAAVEQQALKEPEVDSASATVIQSANGTLSIQMSVILKQSGQQLTIGLQATPAGLVL